MKNNNQKENWIEKIKCKRKNHEDQLCGGCKDCQAFWGLKSLIESILKSEREKLLERIENLEKENKTEQIKQKAGEEFDVIFPENIGDLDICENDWNLHDKLKSFLFSKLSELEKAVRERIAKEIENYKCSECGGICFDKEDALKIVQNPTCQTQKTSIEINLKLCYNENN